ncbi:hypothetical protein ACJRO7_031090 [Eucalyptus globulus]|uniref:Chloroplast envelope membrane protein n=1 Tax=Eucalyptus globulus TaxID=34317 RepID=A0ABD3JPB7_EUCGL
MVKKKAFLPLLYLTSIVFCLGGYLSHLIKQSETFFFFTDIQEKSILEKFIELKELLLLDEMINEYPETHLQTLQSYPYDLHLSTNITPFIILSGYSILGNEELAILKSWVQEFLYNLSDAIKAFSILLLTYLCIRFHSPHDFGFSDNNQIISSLVSFF